MAARDGGVPRLLDASMVDARLEVVDERMQSAGILREGMHNSSSLSFTKHASALTERLAYAVSDADVSPDAQNAHALLRASAAVSTGPQDVTRDRDQRTVVRSLPLFSPTISIKRNASTVREGFPSPRENGLSDKLSRIFMGKRCLQRSLLHTSSIPKHGHFSREGQNANA